MSKIKWSFWNPAFGVDEESKRYMRVDSWQADVMTIVKTILLIGAIIGIVELICHP